MRTNRPIRHEIGSELSEGDHVLLKIENERILEWHPDGESTEAVRKRIDEKLARLRRGAHLKDTDKKEV